MRSHVDDRLDLLSKHTTSGADVANSGRDRFDRRQGRRGSGRVGHPFADGPLDGRRSLRGGRDDPGHGRRHQPFRGGFARDRTQGGGPLWPAGHRAGAEPLAGRAPAGLPLLLLLPRLEPPLPLFEPPLPPPEAILLGDRPSRPSPRPAGGDRGAIRFPRHRSIRTRPGRPRSPRERSRLRAGSGAGTSRSSVARRRAAAGVARRPGPRSRRVRRVRSAGRATSLRDVGGGIGPPPDRGRTA